MRRDETDRCTNPMPLVPVRGGSGGSAPGGGLRSGPFSGRDILLSWGGGGRQGLVELPGPHLAQHALRKRFLRTLELRRRRRYHTLVPFRGAPGAGDVAGVPSPFRSGERFRPGATRQGAPGLRSVKFPSSPPSSPPTHLQAQRTSTTAARSGTRTAAHKMCRERRRDGRGTEGKPENLPAVAPATIGAGPSGVLVADDR